MHCINVMCALYKRHVYGLKANCYPDKKTEMFKRLYCITGNSIMQGVAARLVTSVHEKRPSENLVGNTRLCKGVAAMVQLGLFASRI